MEVFLQAEFAFMVRLLTERLLEMDDGVIILEHVNFVDVGEGLGT